MKQGDRWIIFYTNGDTFTHADGTPWDAPRRSVQSIASLRVDTKGNGEDWYNVNQRDYYYYEPPKEVSPGFWVDVGGWNEAGDLFTVFDHLLRAKHPCVLFGRMLSDAAWRETHKAIVNYCNVHRDFIFGVTDDRPPQRYL